MVDLILCACVVFAAGVICIGVILLLGLGFACTCLFVVCSLFGLLGAGAVGGLDAFDFGLRL